LDRQLGVEGERHALVARQVDQQLPESVARQRVDARGRFVEDQHLGLMNDRYRERQPLANAERQVLGALVDILAEPEASDQFGDSRVGFARRQMK